MNHADAHESAGLTDPEGDRDVRVLLDVAVSDVRRPGRVSDGELIARGYRMRRRRRSAVAGATVVAVAAAVVGTVVLARPGGAGGPGGSDLGAAAGGTPRPAVSTASAAPTPLPLPAERVRALLPAGIGPLTKVTFPHEPRSELNGRYTLRGAGAVGYLEVDVLDPAKDLVPDPSAATLRATDPCRVQPSGSSVRANQDCTNQQLAGGGLLKTWVVPPLGGTGESYTALLVLPDGRSVSLIACSGNPAYGPLMARPPLTRAQLAGLVAEPGWFGA
ncbi:hypothetical protein [Streptacidiphilus jiangxiensis]|uniref:Uncharacterized protein n=1 Tax=Streptacidiphilus jiangxiensis TaxID=235985 RepID=A0A1H7N2K0_STRJI|nr:hypothetical protein [Streptacidiphilus jiangxiensis]SEL17107.1 hypothetical protein SAMN05414137_106162 [Streptacidiphilus jiangxiensis]